MYYKVLNPLPKQEKSQTICKELAPRLGHDCCGPVDTQQRKPAKAWQSEVRPKSSPRAESAMQATPLVWKASYILQGI